MKQARTSIIIGMLVIAGAIAVVLNISANDVLNQQPTLPAANPYPSVEIETPKATYQVGEHLDFTVHTYGICASPNVSIWRVDAGGGVGGGEAVLVYQYMAAPISCPPPERADEPHLIWQAERLVHRISEEGFGGEGNSAITASAAITLKHAGGYMISASLPDRSKSVSADFTVIGITGSQDS